MSRKAVLICMVLLLAVSMTIAKDLVALDPVAVNNRGPVITNELDDWTDLFEVRRFSDATAEYYLGSGSLGDTMCVVFQPLTACSIYVGQIQWFSAGNYQAYVWDYNEAAGALGRSPNRGTSEFSPLGDVVFGPFANSSEGSQAWEELFTPEDLPDGGIAWGDSMFVIGFVKTQDDGLPQPLANDETARRFTYTWFGGPWMAEYDYPWGGYSSNQETGTVVDIMMHALVNYTENPPPIIMNMNQMPNTVNAEKVCTINAEIFDDNGWTTDWAMLNVSLNHGEADQYEMLDPDEDGIFTASFDLAEMGVVVGDQISYWITAEDEVGAANSNVDDQLFFNIIDYTNPNAEMLVLADGMGDRVDVLLEYLDTANRSYEFYDVAENKGIDTYTVDGGAWHTIYTCGWGTLMPTRDYADGPFANAVANGIDFFLSDMDYFYGNSEPAEPAFAPGDMAYDVFGLEGGTNDPVPSDSIFYGEADDVISGPWVDDPYVIYPNLYSGDWADFVIPNVDATSFFVGENQGFEMALRKEVDGWKSMYFGFDIFSNCWMDSVYYPDYEMWVTFLRPTDEFNMLMDNIMDWFEVGEAPGGATMTIDLAPTYFELISTYVQPADLDAAVVFGGVNDLGIVYQDDGSLYIPDLALNTIGDITLTEGYQLFCYSASSLTIEGELVDPMMDYDVYATRWNWLGYPFDHSVNVEDALADIAGDIAIIQTDDGSMWIPGLINTMGDMTPGTGYFIFVNNDVVFQYADAVARTASDVVVMPEVEGAPAATGLPYNVVVRMNDALKTHASTVEIYDGDLLVGKSAVIDNEVTPVTAWGGSVEHNVVGFTSGDAMTINVLDANGSVLATTTTGAFGEGAYADVSLDADLTALPKEFAVEAAYPNPFNPTVTVPFAMPANGELNVMVYNVLGQQVYSSSRQYQAGYHKFVFDASQGDMVSGMYFIQFNYNGQTLTQKLMLLK